MQAYWLILDFTKTLPLLLVKIRGSEQRGHVVCMLAIDFVILKATPFSWGRHDKLWCD